MRIEKNNSREDRGARGLGGDSPAYRTRARFKRRGERGSALLMVFVFLTLMLMFVLANARALHHLRQEMRLIERRQVQKFTGNADRSFVRAVEKTSEKGTIENDQQDPRP